MLTRDKKGGIITKLSHEGQREKSVKNCMNSGVSEKAGLDCHRTVE